MRECTGGCEAVVVEMEAGASRLHPPAHSRPPAPAHTPQAKGARLVAITSVAGSALEALCDLCVQLPLERELCPFDLAPVTSTAIQMVFGDTVAIALMQVCVGVWGGVEAGVGAPACVAACLCAPGAGGEAGCVRGVCGRRALSPIAAHPHPAAAIELPPYCPPYCHCRPST